MEHVGFAAVLVCILIGAAVSRRVQGTIITLPMIYTVLGLLIGSAGLGLVHMGLDSEFIRIVAEVTLAILLATDASRIDLRRLWHDHSLPLRLLLVGLPLTMALGALVAIVMVPQLGLWEAAILAIILAPTDASLGQAVVSNPRVPVRIRQALNIESGLNDGFAMPFLLLAVALALGAETPGGPIDWLLGATSQILLGLLAGVVLGDFAVRFVEWGYRSRWMSSAFQKIATVSLILLAFGAAEMIGGNGFVAAFCMGATAGNLPKRASELDTPVEHAEVEAQVLVLLTFIIFGAVMLPLALDGISASVILYAVLSLTVIRMVPVAISLRGIKVHRATTLFLGWFGPRGLASILYVVTILEAEALAGFALIFDIVMITVLLSVFAHGITAAPLANRYGDYMQAYESEQPSAAEMQTTSENPLRAHPEAMS
jgi:NhaP-type Na+/H+ or K+/H+ antiporter